MPFLSIPPFSLSRSTKLEMPDREKRGIERKGNFIIDLRCYKLFHCTVGPLVRDVLLHPDACVPVRDALHPKMHDCAMAGEWT